MSEAANGIKTGSGVGSERRTSQLAMARLKSQEQAINRRMSEVSRATESKHRVSHATVRSQEEQDQAIKDRSMSKVSRASESKHRASQPTEEQEQGVNVEVGWDSENRRGKNFKSMLKKTKQAGVTLTESKVKASEWEHTLEEMQSKQEALKNMLMQLKKEDFELKHEVSKRQEMLKRAELKQAELKLEELKLAEKLEQVESKTESKHVKPKQVKQGMLKQLESNEPKAEMKQQSQKQKELQSVNLKEQLSKKKVVNNAVAKWRSQLDDVDQALTQKTGRKKSTTDAKKSRSPSKSKKSSPLRESSQSSSMSSATSVPEKSPQTSRRREVKNQIQKKKESVQSLHSHQESSSENCSSSSTSVDQSYQTRNQRRRIGPTTISPRPASAHHARRPDLLVGMKTPFTESLSCIEDCPSRGSFSDDASSYAMKDPTALSRRPSQKYCPSSPEVHSNDPTYQQRMYDSFRFSRDNLRNDSGVESNHSMQNKSVSFIVSLQCRDSKSSREDMVGNQGAMKHSKSDSFDGRGEIVRNSSSQEMMINNTRRMSSIVSHVDSLILIEQETSPHQSVRTQSSHEIIEKTRKGSSIVSHVDSLILIGDCSSTGAVDWQEDDDMSHGAVGLDFNNKVN